MSAQNDSRTFENGMEFNQYPLQFDPYESIIPMHNQVDGLPWSSAYPSLDNSLGHNFGMDNAWPNTMPTWETGNMYSMYPEEPLLPVGMDSYIPPTYPGYQASYPPLLAQPQPGQLTALRTAGFSSQDSEYPSLATPKLPSRSANNLRRRAKKLQKRKAPAAPSSAAPALSAPLSQLIPNADALEAETALFVNRDAEKRIEGVANSRKGRVPRPLNAFILYRKTYQVPAKDLSEGINHKHISKTCGASWRMETAEVRERFAHLAVIEMEGHRRAFPDYKYAPRQYVGEGTALDFDDDE